MSAYSFNARNGLSVGVNPTLVVDNLGNITCNNLTVSGTTSGVSASLSSPSAIGNTTPNTGAFTNLSATGTVSGTGFTSLLSSYAPKASPTFTGTVSGITAAMVGAPGTTGSGASGSWGISITGSSASCTGNAATATTATNLSGGSISATSGSFSSSIYTDSAVYAAGSIWQSVPSIAGAGISYPTTGTAWGQGNNAIAFNWSSNNLYGHIDNVNSAIVCNFSDYRIKDQVVNMTYGLSDVMQLRPINYVSAENTNEKRIGFIAHEVQSIIPEVVMGNKDDTITDATGNVLPRLQSINYEVMVSLLTKGMQEQQALILDLQARLDKAGL
jgi:hypothetical protein